MAGSYVMSIDIIERIGKCQGAHEGLYILLPNTCVHFRIGVSNENL